LGLKRGATHAEFIKSREDGRFYFLEIAARVGGAYIAEVLEAASGINLWREWASNEIENSDYSQGRGEEKLAGNESLASPNYSTGSRGQMSTLSSSE